LVDDPARSADAEHSRGREVWPAYRIAIVLFVAAFTVYNANLRSLTSADTYATRYLPISIINEFNLDLDEFEFLLEYPRGAPDSERKEPYYLTPARGHMMSTYPVTAAILATPVYLVPVLMGLTDDAPYSEQLTRTEIFGTLLSKIAGSIAAALSVAAIFLLASGMTDRRTALLAALAYGFATSTWSVTGQGLWQVSMSTPLLAAALLLFHRADDDSRMILLAAVAMGLSAASRPPNAVLALVWAGFVYARHRPMFVRYCAIVGTMGLVAISYNVYYFASVTGGYSAMVGSLMGLPRFESLMGLLVSPSRGLFIYSPILLLVLPASYTALRKPAEPVVRYSAISFIALVLLYSGWQEWQGAFSFGYRLLNDVLPFGVVVMVPLLARMMTTFSGRAMFAGLMVMSIGIQMVGAFNFPCGWDSDPVPATLNRDRYWDWSDPMVVRCLQAGPVESEGLSLLKNLLGQEEGALPVRR
jgi:hypothetical protein